MADDVERVAAPADPALAFESEARHHLLNTLFKAIERNVDAKHIQIFQMLLMDEVPVEQVAELYRMKTSAIYVIKHRVLERLKAEVARLELDSD